MMKVINKPTFEEHEKLIWHVINKNFAGGRGRNAIGYTVEDLYQLGAIGLLKAIEKFDAEKFSTTSFSTYAVPTIWGTIIKDLRENGYEMRAPRRAREIFNKIRKRQELPTIEEIVKEFQVKELYARLALEMINTAFISMDKAFYQEGNKSIYLHDIIEDEDTDVENLALFNIELQQRFSILDEREKRIIELTRIETPQREIGQELGISQVQVSRILKRAIEKLKNYYEIKEQERIKEQEKLLEEVAV